MLGDYIAIATSDLAIYANGQKFVSLHGSLTPDEMEIPLIVFDWRDASLQIYISTVWIRAEIERSEKSPFSAIFLISSGPYFDSG